MGGRTSDDWRAGHGLMPPFGPTVRVKAALHDGSRAAHVQPPLVRLDLPMEQQQVAQRAEPARTPAAGELPRRQPVRKQERVQRPEVAQADGQHEGGEQQQRARSHGDAGRLVGGWHAQQTQARDVALRQDAVGEGRPSERRRIAAPKKAVQHKQQKEAKIVGSHAAPGERAVVVHVEYASLADATSADARVATGCLRGCLAGLACLVCSGNEARVDRDAEGIVPDRVDP